MLGAIDAQSQAMLAATAAERNISGALRSDYFNSLQSQVLGLQNFYGNVELNANPAVMQRRMMGEEIQTLGIGANMATRAYQQSLPGYARNIERTMGMQAVQGLAMGSELSPEDYRYAQQSSRAAAAARGLTGNQAVGLEVLGGYNLRQQRAAERQQYAQMAYQMGANSQMQGYQMFLNPAYASSSVYGMQGLIGGAEQSIGNLGPQFLNPESQYLADIRNARTQMESANYAARQAKKGSIIGGGLQAAGSFAALSMFCWVAREVYGNENLKWLVFREWLLNDAPKWLLELYKAKGESFAKYISNKPILKAVIRKLMDIAVESKLKSDSKSYA